MAFKAEYTADDILKLYETRKGDGDEKRIREISSTFRELTRMEHAVTIPAQYKAITKEVRTPFVRDAWLRITGSLIAKPPVSHITPKDDKRQDYREAANIGERFDMAMVERISKELGRDIIATLTAQHVRDGESVLKVVHRPSAWANFPERDEKKETADQYTDKTKEYKRGVDLPIAWRDVDRQSIVYEGGEYGDAWVIEYGEYTRPLLKAQYKMVEQDNKLINPRRILEGRPMPEGLNASSTGRSVKVEFFTAKEWHVLIDGSEAPGYPKANPYAPYLPYFRAPAQDSESLLYSLLFLVPRLDELLTMKLNWSYLGAYPNPVFESVPNSNQFPSLDGPLGNVGDAGSQALTWAPGKAIDVPLGKRLSFLSPPPVGKDLNDLVVIFKGLIDIAGVPSVMRGSAGSGDAGYLYNQMMAAAQMMYRQSVLSCQRQLEKAMEFSHWLISNVVQQTVYVLGWEAINPKTGKPQDKAAKAWIGLSPDSQTKNIADISKLGPVSFQYRPTLPTDEQARAMIALQLTNAQKPLYDVRHALEDLMQEEDPESIMDAIWVEQAMNEEPIKGMMIENALRDAGLLPNQQPNPAQELVGPDGRPLLPQPSGMPMLPSPMPGAIQGGPMGPNGPIPMANAQVSGLPSVPGVNMPLVQGTPPPPRGIPGAQGGRVAGTYPGLPSNQGPPV